MAPSGQTWTVVGAVLVLGTGAVGLPVLDRALAGPMMEIGEPVLVSSAAGGDAGTAPPSHPDLPEPPAGPGTSAEPVAVLPDPAPPPAAAPPPPAPAPAVEAPPAPVQPAAPVRDLAQSPESPDSADSAG